MAEQTMDERVGDAIMDAILEHGTFDRALLGRAAIEVMPQPTQFMCRLVAMDHDTTVSEVAVIWTAMCKAALIEPKTMIDAALK